MEIAVTESRKSHGAIPRGPVILLPRAPAVIRSNSASAVKDNRVVYLCSPKGEIELAPDGRLTQDQLNRIGYKKWRRCEAVGSREIEKLSLILARQEFERKRAMKVEQHLREKFFLDQMKVRCRLRMAQGYSKNDAEMNKKILQRAERQENQMYAAIVSEFDPSARTTALEIEVRPQSTSKLAAVGQKRAGVA